MSKRLLLELTNKRIFLHRNVNALVSPEEQERREIFWADFFLRHGIEEREEDGIDLNDLSVWEQMSDGNISIEGEESEGEADEEAVNSGSLEAVREIAPHIFVVSSESAYQEVRDGRNVLAACEKCKKLMKRHHLRSHMQTCSGNETEVSSSSSEDDDSNDEDFDPSSSSKKV